MTNERRALMRAAMVLGCCANAASAQDADWRAELSSMGPGAAYVYNATPLADGGAAFTTSTTAGNWLVRVDAGGTIVARSRILRAGVPVELEGGAIAVLDGGYESPALRVDEICHAERTSQGPVIARAVYEFDAGHGLAGFLAPSLNGHGYPRNEPVHWFARDCGATPGPALDGRHVVRIIQDAPERAAWVLASPEAWSGDKELVYADRHGVRWRRTLPESADLLPADSGIHVTSRRDDVLTLTQLDRTGRERWARTFAGAYATASPAGVLVTAFQRDGTTSRPVSLTLVTDDGRARWTVPTARGPSLSWPMRSAAPPTSVFVQVWDETVRGTGVVEIDAATGRFAERVPPGLLRPLAVLADGTVLTVQLPDPWTSSGTLALWRRGASAPRAIATGGVAPATSTPFALLEDAGVAYAFFRDATGPRVSRVDPDGSVAWSTPLLPGFDSVVRTTLTRDRVCALREAVDRFPRELRIECLDAATGAPAFARTLPGRVTWSRLQGVGDLLHVHAVASPTGSDGSATNRRTHRTYDRFGNVVRELTSTIDASVLAVAPNGSYLTRDETTLFRYTSDAERRFAVPFASLGFDPQRVNSSTALDDGAFIGEQQGFLAPSRYVRLHEDGRVRWETVNGWDTSIARLGRDWLRWTREGSTNTLTRIDDRDGSVQWSRRERWAPDRRVSVSDPEGRAFVVRAPFPLDSHVLPLPAGDTWWYDGTTGRRIGALPGPVDEAPTYMSGGGILRFDRSGALLALRTEVDPDHGRVVLDRRRLPSSAPDPRATVRHAAGRWVATGLAGHSLELAIDRTGRIEGRWLTFDHARGHAIDRQRWFRLDGTAPSTGDRFTLAIRAPDPSRFEAAPPYRAAGTVAWRQHACGEAEIDFRLEGALDDVEGRMRLVRADAFDCERLRAQPRPDSAVWSTADGRAIVLHAAADGSAIGAWTTHAPSASAEAGIPQWLELDVDAGGTLTIARTLGGAFETRATTNTWAIGSGRLERIACDRARLRYRFLDDELAEPFDGRRGELELSRVGGCQR